jgi:hypothetical protein
MNAATGTAENSRLPVAVNSSALRRCVDVPHCLQEWLEGVRGCVPPSFGVQTHPPSNRLLRTEPPGQLGSRAAAVVGAVVLCM